MARKIAFINYKGGVGKTSLTVNFAACLAKLRMRVLVVDCDPQSNASIWLMRLDRWNRLNREGAGTLYRLLMENQLGIDDVIVRDAVCDSEGNHLIPGLDVLPTTFDLIDLDQNYVPMSEQEPHLIFKAKIDSIEDRYDYILFDCSPGLYRSSRCALFASDEVIVPSNADALSLIGFSLVTTKCAQFLLENGIQPGERARILGVVFNHVKSGVKADVVISRFESQMSRFKAQGLLGDEAKIFNTRIRDAVAVSRTTLRGLPVIALSPSETGAGIRSDFWDLVEEVNDGLDRPEEAVEQNGSK